MRRFISILLSLCLCLQMVPMRIFAEGNDGIQILSNIETVTVKEKKEEGNDITENKHLKNKYEFTVDRDYDQILQFDILNIDKDFLAEFEFHIDHKDDVNDLAYELNDHMALVEKEHPYMKVRFHAQDATKNRYNFTLVMKKDGFRETSNVTVNVIDSKFNIKCTEISENPVTMSKTYRLENLGDTISDLSVDLKSEGGLSLVEGVSHYRFFSKSTLDITVLPDYSYSKKLSGELVFTGGFDNKKVEEVHFEAPIDMEELNFHKVLTLNEMYQKPVEDSIDIDALQKEFQETFKMDVEKNEIDLDKNEFHFKANLPNIGGMTIEFTTDTSRYDQLQEGEIRTEEFEDGRYLVQTKVSISKEKIEQLQEKLNLNSQKEAVDNNKEEEIRLSEVLKANRVEITTASSINTLKYNYRSIDSKNFEIMVRLHGDSKSLEVLQDENANWTSKINEGFSLGQNITEAAGYITKSQKLDKLVDNLGNTGKGISTVSFMLDSVDDLNNAFKYSKDSTHTKEDKIAYWTGTAAKIALGAYLTFGNPVGWALVGAAVGSIAVDFALGWLEKNSLVDLFYERKKFRFQQCINRRVARAKFYVPNYGFSSDVKKGYITSRL